MPIEFVDFGELKVSKKIAQALTDMGFEEPTPIQASAIPLLMEGKDIIGQAQTGTGKTAAFGIPIVEMINLKAGVQALVVTPTRELAIQVAEEISRIGRHRRVRTLPIYGGESIDRQIRVLRQGVQVVIGTPGRLLDHLRRRTLNLDDVKMLVLDEADRMLDMGFAEAIADVISYTPNHKQTMLFSATYSDPIREMSRHYQYKPVTVSVEAHHLDSDIEQRFYQTAKARRAHALGYLLAYHRPESTVVFCNTKKDCQNLASELQASGFSVQCLHGDLEQKDRDKVLVRFANKSCSILVATDVAARGLDIKDLQAVINYELPWDPEVYVHRIGRTGRAGKKGLALSLCTEQEAVRVKAIEDYQNAPAIWDEVAPFQMRHEHRFEPPMVTLHIDGGRKNKVRPGDILGALTGEAGLAGSEVGKIDIFDLQSFVAVKRGSVDKALARLKAGKIKGRGFKVRKAS